MSSQKPVSKREGNPIKKAKKALLIVHLKTHFAEFMRLADALANEGEYDPVFCIGYSEYDYSVIPHPIDYAQFLDECLKKGYEVINLEDTFTKDSVKEYIGKKFISSRVNDKYFYKSLTEKPILLSERRSKTPIKQVYDMFLKVVNVYIYFIYYGYYLDYIPKLLIENDIDVIVLPEDNVKYGATIWVKCAKKLKIPSVIIPYTIANATEAAKTLSMRPQYIVNKRYTINWLVSKIYPKWLYQYEDKMLLRRPGLFVWMMEHYEVSTPNPWLFYSTHADALFIENQAMKKYHMESGLPEDNMIITGAAYDDTLADYLHNKEQYRADLYQELELTPNKPLLLVALPPRINATNLPNVDDFQDFDEIVAFWMANCGNIKNWNVVVSLHPSLSYDDYVFIEQWGVKISQRDVSELIAMSDVYLACVSATIRLAIACGIPIINYDVFRFRYQDYVGIDGVFAVEERDDFLEKLQDLTSNENSLKQAQAMIEPFSKQWGMLDGQSTKRIVKTFDELRDKMKTIT